MDPSDSQTQSGEGSRETSEVFDSVFGFLMDFADRAETIVPQPKGRAVVDDDTTNQVHHDEEEEEEEEEEPSEDGGYGNARELFDKWTVRQKKMLLMDAFGWIVWKMLDKLPEDGNEPFLARCYDGLLPKLPRELWRMIAMKVESSRLVEKKGRVHRPLTVGNPQPPPGTGAQQPPQQPPPGTGKQQPPPGTGAQQPPPDPTA